MRTLCIFLSGMIFFWLIASTFSSHTALVFMLILTSWVFGRLIYRLYIDTNRFTGW